MFNVFGNQGGTATIDYPTVGMNGQNRLPDCPPNVIPQQYGTGIPTNGAPINGVPGVFQNNMTGGYVNATHPGHWNPLTCPPMGYGATVSAGTTPWQTVNTGYCGNPGFMQPNTQPFPGTYGAPFINNCCPTTQFGVPNAYPVNLGVPMIQGMPINYPMPMMQPQMPAFTGFNHNNGLANNLTAIPTNFPPVSPTHPWMNTIPVNTDTPFMPNYNGVGGPNVAYQNGPNAAFASTPMFSTGLPNHSPMGGLNPWNTPTYDNWTNPWNLTHNTVPNITGTGWNMADPTGCWNNWNLPTWNMGYPNTAYNGTAGFNPFFFGHGGVTNNPWNTLNHPINSHWNGIGSMHPTFRGNHDNYGFHGTPGFTTPSIGNYGSWNPCNTIGTYGYTGIPTGGLYNPAMMNPTHLGSWPIGTGSYSGLGMNPFCNTPYGTNSAPVNPFAYGSTCCN